MKSGLLWLMLLGCQPLSLVAQEIKFNIPRGMAINTLKLTAIQAEVEIVFTDSSVQGVETPELTGFYTPAQALDRLLEGTQLRIVQDQESGTFAILKAQSAANNPSQNTLKTNDQKMNQRKNNSGLFNRIISSLSAMLVAGTASTTSAQDAFSDDVLILSPFEINTVSETAYQATSAVSAHIAELPLTEIPLQINVLTGDYLEDLGAFTVDDLGTVIPGGSNESLPNGESRGLRLRGFRSPTFTNNFPINPRQDAFWIERVEVAKGPQAVLYGSGAGGGAANFLYKKPKFEDLTSVSVGVGDREYFRTSIDANIVATENIAVRILGHQREIGSQVEHDIDMDTSLYIAGRTKMLDDRLIFDVSYGRYESNDNLGLNGIPGNAANDPQGRFANFFPADAQPFLNVTDKYGLGVGFNIGGPEEFLDYELDIFQAEVVFKISEDLTFRGGFADFVSELQNYSLASPFLNIAREKFGVPTRGVTNPQNINGDIRGAGRQAARFDLLYEKSFLSMDHKLVISVRQNRSSGKADEWTRRRIRISGDPSDLSRGYIDVPQQVTEILFGPQEVIPALAEEIPNGVVYDGRTVSQARFVANIPELVQRSGWTTNVSVTDHVKFWDGRANILAGVSRIEAGDEFDAETVFSAGSIVEVLDGVHLFYNFSQDFTPDGFRDRAGNFVPNTSDGEGYDFGVRLELLEGKLNGTLSYFFVERTGIPRRVNIADDPNTPEDEQESFFVRSGAVESSGWEFTLDYNPTKNWNINIQGSFSDPKTVSDIEDPRLEGHPLEDTIPNSMVFGTRYEFDDDGNLGGVKVGVNGWWRDEGLTDARYLRRFLKTTEHEIINFFVSKDFTLMGGKLDTTLRLDVQNVMDVDDAVRSQSTYQRGRVIFATAKFRF